MKKNVILLFFSMLVQISLCNASDLAQKKVDREVEMERRMQEIRDRNEAIRLAQEQRRHQEREAAMNRRMQEVRARNEAARLTEEREFARRAMAGISDPADDRQESGVNGRVGSIAMLNRRAIRRRIMRIDPDFIQLPSILQEQILDRMIAWIAAQEAREKAPIERMDDLPKQALKDRWFTWLKGKSFSDANDPDTRCCICLEENDTEHAMNYLPCKQLHPNVICLDCLSTIMANPKYDDNDRAAVCCPLCNTVLKF